MEDGESQIPWMTDDVFSRSTTVPDDIVEGGSPATIIIFVISALFTISLLFGLAVFIDCRHQKIDENKKKIKHRINKIPKFHMPKQEDKDFIIENMEENESSVSAVIV